MSAPAAAVNVDLDGVACHLAGYGLPARTAHPDPVYDRALPRLLELLDEMRIRATIFAVGRPAARHARRIRAAAEAGHEIASHSDTHPQPFSTLDAPSLRREVAGSKARLEDLTGRPVDGFRAPGWDVDARVLGAVARAGYRYDASILPSPAVAAIRLVVRLRGRGHAIPLGLRTHLLSRRRPHRRAGAGWELLEVPLPTAPLLGFPLYHTTVYALPVRLIEALGALHRACGRPLPYAFHGVDLVDAGDPQLDARLLRHPGMRLPLATKRALLRRRLEWIAARYTCATMGEVAASGARPALPTVGVAGEAIS